MNSVGTLQKISRRIRACDYLSVAQLYLKSNFLLERSLIPSDIKPRLLGHWGTCHGINVAYANLKTYFHNDANFSFVLGPGHGFPALNANLFLDGELLKIDPHATLDADGIAYLCRNFSWPGGFPSHASPMTPHVITEGGELGYSLANAYGAILGHPEKTIAVLIGDGELETATAVDSLNLRSLCNGPHNGRVLPILHLNGYKISAPSIYARRPRRELMAMFEGFGFTPVMIDGDEPVKFQHALDKDASNSFYILKTEKGAGGPNRGHEAHQIPLKNPASDAAELSQLEAWLKSYHFESLFNEEGGFRI